MPPRTRIGIVGWNYPEWKGLVYERHARPADFLHQYAERFPMVEAASSYYGMPKPAAIASWTESAPEGFEIAMKVPDWILKRTGADLASGIAAFLERIEPLSRAGKLGTLVAQFHPSFTREKRAEELAAFVRALPEGPRFAVELRHDSWWRRETYDLLTDAGVTLVWSDLGEALTPPVVTTDALYVRLFGDRELPPPYDKTRRDAGEKLALWAERVRGVADAVRRIDIVVSKFLEGYAPASAERLSAMLDLPPPDVAAHEGRPHARQTTLPGL